jgi:hypothetical protein
VHRIRVYVDNSVFGGAHDEEFAEDSRRFFDGVRAGRYAVLVCDVLYEEILQAPEEVQEVLTSLPPGGVEEVPITDEVGDLAEAYVSAGAAGPRSRGDAVQVAAATVARASLLLSWNFKHLVDYERIQRFNAVNLANGYGLIDIRSPKEMGHAGEDV